MIPAAIHAMGTQRRQTNARFMDGPSFWAYLRHLQTGLLAHCGPPPELEGVRGR